MELTEQLTIDTDRVTMNMFSLIASAKTLKHLTKLKIPLGNKNKDFSALFLQETIPTVLNSLILKKLDHQFFINQLNVDNLPEDIVEAIKERKLHLPEQKTILKELMMLKNNLPDEVFTLETHKFLRVPHGTDILQLVNDLFESYDIDDQILLELCDRKNEISPEVLEGFLFIGKQWNYRNMSMVTYKGFNRFVQTFLSVPTLEYLVWAFDARWLHLMTLTTFLKFGQCSEEKRTSNPSNITYHFADNLLEKSVTTIDFSHACYIKFFENVQHDCKFEMSAENHETFMDVFIELFLPRNNHQQRNIEVLDLSNLDVDDTLLKEIANKYHLNWSFPKKIVLHNNPKITGAGMRSLYHIASQGMTEIIVDEINANESPFRFMLSNGIHETIVQQYHTISKKGCKRCNIPLVFYSIICFPVAIAQWITLSVREFTKTRFGLRATQFLVGLGLIDKPRSMYFDFTQIDTYAKLDTPDVFKQWKIERPRILMYITFGVLHYFFSIFLAIQFMSTCNEGHNPLVFMGFGIFMIFPLAMEYYLSQDFELIKETNKVLLIIKLLLSQVAKVSLFSNLIYGTSRLACGGTIAGAISISMTGLIALFNFITFIYNCVKWYRCVRREALENRPLKLETFTCILHVNYALDFTLLSQTMEVTAPDVTLRICGVSIPRTILANSMKFAVQNVTNFILQVLTYAASVDIGNPQQLLFSFVVSILNLQYSFFIAVTSRPARCTVKMIQLRCQYGKDKEASFKDCIKYRTKRPGIFRRRGCSECCLYKERLPLKLIQVKSKWQSKKMARLISIKESPKSSPKVKQGRRMGRLIVQV
jgi:hypothetical protein